MPFPSGSSMPTTHAPKRPSWGAVIFTRRAASVGRGGPRFAAGEPQGDARRPSPGGGQHEHGVARDKAGHPGLIERFPETENIRVELPRPGEVVHIQVDLVQPPNAVPLAVGCQPPLGEPPRSNTL